MKTARTRVVPIEPEHDQIEAAYVLVDGLNPRKAKDLCRSIYRTMIEHARVQRTGTRLTRTQRQVLELICEGIEETGRSPTVRQLAALRGHIDHKATWLTIQVLRRKNVIRSGSNPRDIRVLLRPEEA